MDPPGASWGSRTRCWALGWPHSMSKESHNGEGTGTGSGPPLVRWLAGGTWGAAKGGNGTLQVKLITSPLKELPRGRFILLLAMTTGSFPAGKPGSDVGSLHGLGCLLSFSCTLACFEGNISFQGPEFPHFLPLSRAASSATQTANSQAKSCCVPVPAPCTPQHLFLFEAGHKLLHRLVTAQAADLKAERVIARNTSTRRENLVERTEQEAPARWEK